jgi:hypothetical protein
MAGGSDPNLCRNATEYTNNHKYKDAVEITLHFINIKELKLFTDRMEIN